MSKTMKESVGDLSVSVQQTMLYFNKLDKSNLPELLKAFRQLHEVKADMDILCKAINALHKEISEEVIPTALEGIGFESVKANGRLFVVTPGIRASITQEQQEKGFAWLKANNMDSLIKNNVNAKTLTSAIKTNFEENGILPPQDAITTYMYKYTSIRKP